MDSDQLPRLGRALIAVALLGAGVALAAAPAPQQQLPGVEAPAAPEAATPQGAPPSAETPPAEKPPSQPPTLTNFTFDWRQIIPIPEFIIDPNEGNTYGILFAYLVKDDQDEVRYMFAPDFRYNATKGAFPNFRLFGYPTATERYSILIGKSTTRDENYEIEYADRGLWDARAFVLAHFLFARDSTERFWGFGNESLQSQESNYTSQDLFGDLNPGVWLLPQVSLSYRMRIRRFSVQPGQVTSEPFIAVEHPDVRTRGLEPGHYFQHEIALTYDTRDSIDQPTGGTYANAYVDGANQHLGSSTGFTAFGFQCREFVPFRGEKKNPILAMRALIDYLQGGTHTPFWLMNDLGGRTYLRGYGGDRFIDLNRFLMSAELRTRVYERRLFGVNTQLELAPYVEAGRVFHEISNSPVNDMHWVGGLGFRGVVRPQIVAFVDIGRGDEGTKVFTGIDYPF